MSKLLQCDNCERTTPASLTYGWIGTKALGDLMTDALGFMEHQFCGWSCVAIFAQKVEESRRTSGNG
jgi:hypothetical protein